MGRAEGDSCVSLGSGRFPQILLQPDPIFWMGKLIAEGCGEPLGSILSVLAATCSDKKSIDGEKAGGKEKRKIMGERLEKASDSLMGLLME